MDDKFWKNKIRLNLKRNNEYSNCQLILIKSQENSNQEMINEISLNSSNTIQLSRGELLMWLNELLNCNLTKIEQLGSGSVYCQLLDLLYPGKVQLSKVNFKAKNQYEYICNFKILQQHFTKFGILRNIDVERLIKCRYQDNLQFLQWFKKIFDNHYASKGDQDIFKRSMSEQDSYISQDKQNKKPTKVLNFSIYDSQKYQSLNEMSKLQFPVVNQRQTHSSTSRPKNEQKYKRQNTSFIKLSTQRINMAEYRGQSLQTSAIDFPKQVSAIQQISGTKPKQPYYSPSKYIEKESFYRTQNHGIINQQREFYLKKFRQIEHLLQIWEKEVACVKLVTEIRKVIMLPPSSLSTAGEQWKVDEQTGQIVFLHENTLQVKSTASFQQTQYNQPMPFREQ